MKPRLSVCIPVYKGSEFLKNALDSIVQDTFKNYEIIVCDDTPCQLQGERKKIEKIVKSYKNLNVRYYKNSRNIGAQKNIQRLVKLAKNDRIVFLCQDDVFINNPLQKIADAYTKYKTIGAVTRPYYWFDDNISTAVRAELPISYKEDVLISLPTNEKYYTTILNSLGQISGLSYRKSFISIPFHNDIFPGHIYPFLGILKKHSCIFLKDFIVAVGIKSSQTRSNSTLYDKSPTLSWIKMFDTVFSEKQYKSLRTWGIEHIAKHYEGLVQIKNYGSEMAVLKEIKILLTHRWMNIFDIRFWLYAATTLVMPKILLRPLTDAYKRMFLALKLKFIHERYFVQQQDTSQA